MECIDVHTEAPLCHVVRVALGLSELITYTAKTRFVVLNSFQVPREPTWQLNPSLGISSCYPDADCTESADPRQFVKQKKNDKAAA